MDIRQELHQALDEEDFPSPTLLVHAMSRLDEPLRTKAHGWQALVAVILAVALVATFLGIRANRQILKPTATATSSTSAAPSATVPQYLGPITTAVDYGGPNHIHLRPPNGSPAISWTSAVYPCRTFCGLAQTQAPVVELVSYSDDQYGEVFASSTRPTYQNVLAYVVLWRGVRCLTFGPPGAPTPDPNIKCDAFYFVDAKTGAQLAAYMSNEP